MTVTQPIGQLARWLETLSEYNFMLQHRKGLKHNNVDGLSCQRCSDCKQCGRMRGPEEVDGTDRTGGNTAYSGSWQTSATAQKKVLAMPQESFERQDKQPRRDHWELLEHKNRFPSYIN